MHIIVCGCPVRIFLYLRDIVVLRYINYINLHFYFTTLTFLDFLPCHVPYFFQFWLEYTD